MIKFRDLLVIAAAAGVLAALATPVFAQDVQTPPPVPDEVIGALPGATETWTWRPGHWVWDGVRYRWARGEYFHTINSNTQAVWVPGHWTPGPDGYVWIDGHWR